MHAKIKSLAPFPVNNDAVMQSVKILIVKRAHTSNWRGLLSVIVLQVRLGFLTMKRSGFQEMALERELLFPFRVLKGMVHYPRHTGFCLPSLFFPNEKPSASLSAIRATSMDGIANLFNNAPVGFFFLVIWSSDPHAVVSLRVSIVGAWLML